MLKNTAHTFGSLTKLFHWLIFALFCVQYYLIWDRSLFPDNAPERTPLIMTHKSVGMTLLGLALLFVIWKAINRRPDRLPDDRFSQTLSKIVQHSLLTIMVLMPLTGFLLSCAAGRSVSFWGWFNFPNILPKSKMLANVFGTTHEVLAYAIVALVSLHVVGAIRHHFFLKDNTVKRILPFTK